MRSCAGVVLALVAALTFGGCAGKTAGASGVTDAAATLHATARCDAGETCRWYWEYWPASQPRSTSARTAVQGPVAGATGDQSFSATVTGLRPSTAYRWVFCGSPNNGGGYACAGPAGRFGSATADPPPDSATFTTATRKTLAERWDGTSWTVQTTPGGAGDSTLSGVSCTSAIACTAVGNAIDGGGTQVSLAERWDGTSWTIQPTPAPSGVRSSFLSGVACTSATSCAAVGGSTDSAGTQSTLAERWDGTSWAIQPTPNPTPGSELAGVACSATTACTAVGFSQDGTLAERWNGTAWAAQTVPSPTPDSSLTGVACPSATACTAVGRSSAGHTVAPLAEAWNGTTWAVQPTPGLGADGILSDVSCTAAAACTAAGSGNGTLAERWNGTAWAIQSTPSPTGGSALSGVACSSATACTAAGNAGGTLAERWNGTTWAIQPTPSLTGLPALSAVACPSATACTAVGAR